MGTGHAQRYGRITAFKYDTNRREIEYEAAHCPQTMNVRPAFHTRHRRLIIGLLRGTDSSTTRRDRYLHACVCGCVCVCSCVCVCAQNERHRLFIWPAVPLFECPAVASIAHVSVLAAK